MSVIRTEQLSKRYGRRIGIHGVSIDVAEGDLFGFLGPNGAGKSTTIRVLLGFLKPSGGRARIFEQDCWRNSSKIKQNVGYVPGDLRLYPWMTATNALSLVGQIRGVDVTETGLELAERFRLEATVRVRQMSRGMRQKLGLILALAHQPRLVILDEPTSGLDPLMQQELAACLREMAADGRTVFFSSHTLSEVEQLCDRVAIVRDGQIVADETLDSLRSQARRAVIVEFNDTDAADRVPVPGMLKRLERSSTQWRCELTGSAPDLIGWAAEQPLRDIRIGDPDLETLFSRYYRAEGTSE